jgi:hypothetical protein
MTAARQPGKPARTRPYLAFAGTVLLLGILAPVVVGAAGTLPAVVANDHTGLAISGFDPVAYFTDHAPKVGRPDLELSQGGGVWRFRNEGNRAEFAKHPDVYMPQFDGYDPVAIARGTSVPGHPLFWAVMSERLYLFFSDQARAEFLADSGRIIDRATRKWPEVARTMPR